MLTTILDLVGMAFVLAALAFLIIVLLPWPWNVFLALLVTGILVTCISLAVTKRGGGK